jgi:hypothetical protein
VRKKNSLWEFREEEIDMNPGKYPTSDTNETKQDAALKPYMLGRNFNHQNKSSSTVDFSAVASREFVSENNNENERRDGFHNEITTTPSHRHKYKEFQWTPIRERSASSLRTPIRHTPSPLQFPSQERDGTNAATRMSKHLRMKIHANTVWEFEKVANSLPATRQSCRGDSPILDKDIPMVSVASSAPLSSAEVLSFFHETILDDKSIQKSFVHSDQDLQFPLIGREQQIMETVQLFKIRQEAYKHSRGDRLLYKIPIFCGLPGTGKTRLLESYPRYLRELGIPIDQSLSIIVPYYNGHKIHSVDILWDVERSFSARMLFTYFYEIRQSSIGKFKGYMDSILQRNSSFSFRESMLAIKQAHVREWTEPLVIFLGIDEYQSLGGTKLEELTELLFEASMDLKEQGIHLYPVMAGTEWDRMERFGSSKLLPKRISVTFLNAQQSLKLAYYHSQDLIASAANRHCIFELGGIPRHIVEYCARVRSSCTGDQFPPAELFDQEKQSVIRDYGNVSKLLNNVDLIKLVAYSFSKCLLSPLESSGISLLPKDSTEAPSDKPLTWQGLADRGILILDMVTDLQGRVVLPFYLLEKCCDLVISITVWTEIQAKFLNSLFYTLDAIKNFEVDPWKTWERFGAWYYCLIINSLCLIGKTNIPLRHLLSGCSTTPRYELQIQETTVLLRPMTVVESSVRFNEVTSSFFPQNGNEVHSVNMFDGNAVFLNADRGLGVDIVFSLKIDCQWEEHLIILDQRKREAAILTKSYLESLHEMLEKSVPKCLKESTSKTEMKRIAEITHTLEGKKRLRVSAKTSSIPSHRILNVLFSTWGRFGNHCKAIPVDLVVFGWKEIREFLSPFSNHPVVTGLVDVNFINKTLIENLTGVNSKVANLLIEKRRSTYVKSLQQLKELLHPAVMSEKHLDLLFFVEDYNG